ncbi:hypothetical protein AB0H76_15440 [Nocardia sp. NPDC050712]|uniref:hypothetical protein n=1 Tax=Nocardia sp. NPDC050712 TaxID=3155518 RepID=UPI0033F78AB2
MAFQVGDKVQVKASPVTVFKVLEILETDENREPTRVLVEPVLDAPGAYPYSYKVADLVAYQPED